MYHTSGQRGGSERLFPPPCRKGCQSFRTPGNRRLRPASRTQTHPCCTPAVPKTEVGAEQQARSEGTRMGVCGTAHHYVEHVALRSGSEALVGEGMWVTCTGMHQVQSTWKLAIDISVDNAKRTSVLGKSQHFFTFHCPEFWTRKT